MDHQQLGKRMTHRIKTTLGSHMAAKGNVSEFHYGLAHHPTQRRRSLAERHSFREHAGRSRPGCWIFVGPDSEKTWKFDTRENPDTAEETWDREALQIMKTLHRDWPPSHSSKERRSSSCVFFVRNAGKDNLFVNASDQSIGMIC